MLNSGQDPDECDDPIFIWIPLRFTKDADSSNAGRPKNIYKVQVLGKKNTLH